MTQNPLNLVDPNGKFAQAAPWVIPPLVEGLRWCAIGLGLIVLAEDCTDDNGCFENEDKKDCKKASRWQMKKAGIYDNWGSEHAYKSDYNAVPNARFDICACKDGSIVIKEVGKCGKPGAGIPTYESWK